MRDPEQSNEPQDGRADTASVPDAGAYFESVLDAIVDYAIAVLDVSGRIVAWNAGAERITGYRRDEIVGSHFSRLYTSEGLERGWPEHELREALRTGRVEDQGWRVRKDGSQYWAHVVMTAVHDTAGNVRGIAKIVRDLSEQRAAEDHLRHAQTELEARVEQRTAELAHVNSTLLSEVAERHRLEQELRRTVSQLRDADRAKNEFLAVLAHELRNPLAPIRNGIEFLKLRGTQDEQTRRAQEIVERQIDQMTRLIEDLLDISRVTRNALTLRRDRVDMAAVVRDATDAARPLIEANAHQLTVQLPETRIFADVDGARLSQVLANLLNNAAKFTPRGGLISLTLESNGNEVIARVRDNGIGIPADTLPRVFDLFTQGSRGIHAQSGLGIGLTLSKRLIDLHGGTLEAHSAGEGRGSEFVVRVPVQGIQSTDADTDHQKLAQKIEPLPPRRILIVDDNRDSVESLRMVLTMLGSHIKVGYDGVDAVTLAHEFRPDIALIDLGMPRMNGYEAARRIRLQPWGRAIKLVAMTGWGQEEDRRRAREAGFDLHMTKPVDPIALRELLLEPLETK